MAFRVEGSERLRIDSSGNVGIGTTSPDSNVKLDLNSGTNNVPLGVESTDTNVFIAMKDSGTTGTYGTAAVAVGANSDNLLLRAGSAERMRIDSSGNVGIGTSSPSASLEIYGSDDSNNLIVGMILCCPDSTWVITKRTFGGSIISTIFLGQRTPVVIPFRINDRQHLTALKWHFDDMFVW